MKRIYIKILAAALFVCILPSCEDFLSRTPYDAVAAGTSFVTEDDAVAAVNGAYQPLQWAKITNMRLWPLDIVAGNSLVGGGGGNDGIETKDMADFITKTDNAGVLDMYRGYSPGILRSNFVLANVPGMDINDQIKNRCLGEAHFLRALYYFYQVRLFGEVPLVTKPLAYDDDLMLKRAPVDSIYRLIVSDFEKSAELLPLSGSYSASDLGRASKGAAYAFLAKVYLTHRFRFDAQGNVSFDEDAEFDDVRRYEIVNEYCEKVSACGYALNDDYSDNFNPEKKNGKESIFEVQYYGKTKAGFWSNENQGCWLSCFMGPRNSGLVAGAYGWNLPTAEFVMLYEEGDLRKDKTIFYTGCPLFDGMPYQSSWSETGYNVRKFLVPKSVAPTYDDCPGNFPLLRYADILLVQAEVLNELNRRDEAIEKLSMVRERAGLKDNASFALLSKRELRERIYLERRIELAFEAHRWFDLIRVENEDYPKGEYAREWFHSIGKLNFNPEKHMLFPIPMKERQSNPNLTQNPGY